MRNILFSRWFGFCIQVLLILLIGLDTLLLKTIYLSVIVIVLEIIVLTITNIKDSKRDRDNKKVEEWRDNKIKKVGEEIKEISSEKKETDDLIRIMINEGVIDDKNLLKKIKQKSFIAIYCYQKSPGSLAKDFREIIGRQPVLSVLEDLGFYRLGANHNFYLIDEKDLSKELRSLNQLEFFLSKRLEMIWARYLNTLKNKNKKLFEKYKNKQIWNFSYFIAKVLSGNSLVGHMNWSSFTPESKAKILRNIKYQEIKKEINFHKISNLIKELNFRLLIRDLPTGDKKELLKLKDFEKELSIKEFRDYGKIPLVTYKSFFNKHFNTEKTNYYLKFISNKAKKYNEALDKFGIVIPGEN
ncbi:hypothetical protein J4455_00560 [Candidatus Woesearchaeota archaeon]|nr:hypothetical protein [Candidatus Woesearchaeota archaeon]